MNLFDHAEKYPQSPGYAKGSETSREAAQRLTSRDAIAEIVLSAVDSSGKFGVTVDEVRPKVEASLGTKERTSIAARFTELEAQGLIRKAGKRDNGRGRNVNYYISN